MELVRLDVHRFDVDKIAGLIYETDSKTYDFYFNSRKNAVDKISIMIKEGNNNLGYHNIYVITGGKYQVYGIMVIATREGQNNFENFRLYFKKFNFLDALKLISLDLVDGLFCAKLEEGDLYLASVAVDNKCRGRGLGKFLLEKALEIATEMGCKRMVLDVDLENEIALSLYQNFGFKEFNSLIILWIGGKKGIYNMEYLIKK